jgi:2-oxoglutarate ferredoxin oxidoreductase subunit alpha
MPEKVLMKGNEALGEAAIIAGCRHYFAYPITPQNEVSEYLSRRLPQVDGVFLQAESEIAAINMVMGASAAGARAMTSSSSPGIALKQEGISYLSGAELPAVVVNVQRGGPGLGNIAGAQGDYFQATKGGGNGDYQTIVLAPSTVQELAELTVEAFDLADENRMVVLILADGYLGQISEPVIMPEPTNKIIDKSSWALTGARDRQSRVIASIRLIPDEALSLHNKHLQERYRKIKNEIRRFQTYQAEDAEYLLVAFGTSARVCQAALNALRKAGIKAGLFRPITLWPFPDRELAAASKELKKVLVVEMNAGQMLEDVQLAFAGKTEIDFYGEMGGLTPDAEVIIERVKSYE